MPPIGETNEIILLKTPAELLAARNRRVQTRIDFWRDARRAPPVTQQQTSLGPPRSQIPPALLP